MPVPLQNDIVHTQLKENDRMVQIIYETLYAQYDFMPTWKNLPYFAPETQAGYAARLIQKAVNNVRLEFLCTPIE